MKSKEVFFEAPILKIFVFRCYYVHYLNVEGFEVISLLENVEIIAVGSGIRDIERLRKIYGSGR